jgi:hypothetical protein
MSERGQTEEQEDPIVTTWASILCASSLQQPLLIVNTGRRHRQTCLKPWARYRRSMSIPQVSPFEMFVKIQRERLLDPHFSRRSLALQRRPDRIWITVNDWESLSAYRVRDPESHLRVTRIKFCE